MARSKSSSPLEIEVYAKINLSLRILGKIEGGYHSVETIFQNISLADRMKFTVADGETEVRCSHPAVPEGKENLAYQAAVSCLEILKVKDKGLLIEIEKGIPVGGGLGGGSADAAGTILACEKLFGPVPGGDTTRFALAAALGADVPFLLYGGRALAWGIGERMLQLPVKGSTPVLLIIPDIAVSTSWAYRALDDTRSEGIHTEIMDVNSGPLNWEELLGQLGPTGGLVNDFEPVVFAYHPKLRDLKLRLREAGADVALMSGSGSAIFGLFKDRKKRDRALEVLEADRNFRLAPAEFVDRAFRIVS
ncbi:MAG: 4-(cytidine 5'-diphospho)-2-C-methyl-D-erythritol kinase [Candidatus Glassbacteria bacterium]|nr:4-(cytidine 5'-diphospho)-2-C-methyl-D-erythritol kinase [Candidatus Glassbacteria bacterium]